MSHFRKIATRIWHDEKYRSLSRDAKFVFFFILTHPHLTSLGAMRATIQGLAAEEAWPLEDFQKAFDEVLSKGLLKHDREASFLWAPNFLKYNGPESPNVVKSWAKSLDLLPECELKNELMQRVKAFVKGLSKGFGKALPEAFAKGMANQEQEQEQEQERRGAANAAETPRELLSLIDWWNGMKQSGLVASGVLREPISEDLRKGWKRLQKCKDVRDLLSDRNALEREIAASNFLRGGWFTLAKLMGGRNQDGAYIARRIIERGYRDGANHAEERQSAGKSYDQNAEPDF